MLKKLYGYKKFILSFIIAIALTVSIFTAFLLKSIDRNSQSLIYTQISQVPQKYTGLILGAYVYPDGRLSDMLRDRADTAIELYQAGKIERLLVSGDHGTTAYDEVNTIRDYLLLRGVDAADIFLDHAGFDTYDSLYRAREIFQADSLIVITQEFHLPRAIFIGKALGLDVVGVKADKYRYAGVATNYLREIPANLKAFADTVVNSQPKYLGPQIPIAGNSKLSWDKL
jgi:SanA protein